MCLLLEISMENTLHLTMHITLLCTRKNGGVYHLVCLISFPPLHIRGCQISSPHPLPNLYLLPFWKKRWSPELKNEDTNQQQEIEAFYPRQKTTTLEKFSGRGGSQSNRYIILSGGLVGESFWTSPQ